MSGYGALVATSALFFLAHMLPRKLGWRDALVSRYGARAYGMGYGIVSLITFIAALVAMRLAPVDPLGTRAPWMLWAPVVVMPVAVALFLAGLRTPNALSIPIRATKFDPEQPGFLAITRHPLPFAFALWAGAHLIALADIRALIFFGPLLVISIAAPWLLDKRHRRTMGPEVWQEAAKKTAFFDLSAVRLRPWSWPVLEAVAFFALLLVLHMNMLRVNPLPLTDVFSWWGTG